MRPRLPEKQRQAVIEAQGGLCACGCGRDLRALEAATALHIKLPKGRRPVEIDHVQPRSEAFMHGGELKVHAPGYPHGVLCHVDSLLNLQALSGWCHQDKIDAEREGYRRGVPLKAGLGVVPSRGEAPAADNRARREAKGRRIGTRKRAG